MLVDLIETTRSDSHSPQDFVYDNRKLQDVIVKQVEASGWVGVCCEPNAVFVVCNQFPVSIESIAFLGKIGLTRATAARHPPE